MQSFLTKGRVQTFFPSALKFAAIMTIRIRNRAAPKAAGNGPNAPADGLQQGRAYPAAPHRALANTYWGLYAYHVDGDVDPLRDVDTIETELLLADLQSVEKRLDKLQKLAKGSKDAKAAAEIMQTLLAQLNDGKPARGFSLPENELFMTTWRELGLLTAKPVIYCANVDEAAVADGNGFSATLESFAKERQAGFARICAKLEEELQGLPDEEQAELLASYGIDESGLVRIIHTGYATLGLYSYFTAGPDEVRAWTIHKGWKAPQAAGVIHTDFERGFIRAEVISYADYMCALPEPQKLPLNAAARRSSKGRSYPTSLWMVCWVQASAANCDQMRWSLCARLIPCKTAPLCWRLTFPRGWTDAPACP